MSNSIEGDQLTDSDKTVRSILGIFAHPDDETTSAGGTMAMYASKGTRVQVITATRGELGTLGQDGESFTREELPAVREAELGSVMRHIGAREPVVLDYRDQELDKADVEEVSAQMLAVMRDARPDVVITWGPNGISGHVDHVAVHEAAVRAFHRYRATAANSPRLFYVAIPRDLAERFGLDVDGPEAEPTLTIDIMEVMDVKVSALRLYVSQQDAIEVASQMEEEGFTFEAFHQAWPERCTEGMETGLW